ncbi:MAG: hypothetical protein KDN05_03745, partial [Verrucomicrobiae bacterium]|nr:hypothetical protein [Verrucomicrobiae bacterium]
LDLRFHSIASEADAPAAAERLDRMPGSDSPAAPRDGWDLIELAAAMERAWLDRLAADADFDVLSIGFSCRIHPDAVLTPPYFIGDHVSIGPGCRIGPHAVIGEGSVISGANVVAHSHLSAHSFLGPVTALERCRLESGVLLSLKNRTRLDDMEPHLVSSLAKPAAAVPLRERIEALRLYLRLRGTRPPSGRFRTFDGLDLPGDPSDGGLGNRVAWLPLVWQGKLRLYGVLPRTSEQLDALDADWRGALRHSPAGVFSYADCQGCHSPGDPEEALHAVYQASLPPETLAGSIASFARGLRSRDLNRSTA